MIRIARPCKINPSLAHLLCQPLCYCTVAGHTVAPLRVVVDIDQLLAPSRVNFVHPDDRERYLVEKNKEFLRGEPHEIEARLLRHDGTYRSFLIRRNPFKDERGNVTRWYGTGIDIEDRKQAELRLQAQEIELRQMLDLTPQVAVFGPNREPLYANRFTLDYLGMGLDEWQLGSLASNVHPDDFERLNAAADRAISAGLLSSWRYGYAKRMEVIAGFLFATTRSATARE
jgi:PAS domain-containing protein